MAWRTSKRNLGRGDSDTLAAITVGVAEAYYEIPDGFGMQALPCLDDDLIAMVDAFEKAYPRRLKTAKSEN